MGPTFYDTQSIAAGAAVDVVAGWLYRRLPWPAILRTAYDATAVGMVATMTLGSDMQIGPEFPVPAGGTAGQFPVEEAQFQDLLGAANDLITLLFRNTTAGAIDVNTVIKLAPTGF